MPETDPEKKRVALEFLKAHRTGVLTTVSQGGAPRARLVYYSCDDTFTVFFLTVAGTRKVADLAANPRAAFIVADEAVPKTLQIEGIVDDLTERGVIDHALSKLTEHWLSNTVYGAPVARFDSNTIRYYRLTPSWIRWGDFTAGHNTSEVLMEIPAP